MILLAILAYCICATIKIVIIDILKKKK